MTGLQDGIPSSRTFFFCSLAHFQICPLFFPDEPMSHWDNEAICKLSQNLYTPSLGRPASVVRNGSDVANVTHFQSGGGESANGGLATGARARDAHFKSAHAVLARHVGGVHGRLLRGKGRALARSAEAERAGALPGEHAPFGIGDGDQR